MWSLVTSFIATVVCLPLCPRITELFLKLGIEERVLVKPHFSKPRTSQNIDLQGKEEELIRCCCPVDRQAALASYLMQHKN